MQICRGSRFHLGGNVWNCVNKLRATACLKAFLNPHLIQTHKEKGLVAAAAAESGTMSERETAPAASLCGDRRVSPT